jgi:hypothetical protein
MAKSDGIKMGFRGIKIDPRKSADIEARGVRK